MTIEAVLAECQKAAPHIAWVVTNADADVAPLEVADSDKDLRIRLHSSGTWSASWYCPMNDKNGKLVGRAYTAKTAAAALTEVQQMAQKRIQQMQNKVNEATALLQKLLP